MEWISTSIEDANYNFYVSLITGDTIDNIKGLSGRGIVFANKLLSDCRDDNDCYKYINRIQGCYIQHLGEQQGINQFYINYNLLKLLDKYEGFEIPNILKYELSDIQILGNEEISEIE
jgi:5'-3' exonuclease